MVQPLFFEPDPGIPDSDLLGYGDLIYNDGTREFISGDPELASMFPAPDGGLGQYEAPEQDPLIDMPLPEFDPLEQEDPMGAPIEEEEPEEYDLEAVPVPGAPGTTVDINNGQIRQGTTTVEHIGREVPIPPDGRASVNMSTGNITPMDGGYGTGGMVPVQRDGALPPQLAQQQAADREALYGQQYQAMEQGRQQELAIYRKANAERMGQLQAEEKQLRAQQQEQQAKLQRWQEEQRLTADLDIKTDLTSAVGVMGSILAVVGAALSGYNPDAHSRMLDSVIDQSVRKQINQRDTKLRVLADRIGSTEQAIATGKAQLYKTIAEKVEMSQKMTQADIFEQQTPQLLADLKAKQLQNEQQAQAISLGKTTERLPQPAKQSAGQLAAQMKYGKAAAEQESTENEIMRAANQLGLKGWNSETGKFENRDQVLSEGIKGVGRQDSFAARNEDIPVIGKLGRAVDEALTSDKGLANRASLESLANAEAARTNPGKAPSDADRQSAKLSLGTLTEAGAVEAIERLMKWQETQRAQNLSIYGPEAAAAYEMRRDATGVPRAQVGPGGDTGEQLAAGSAREQIAAYRSGQRQGTTEVTDRMGERPVQQEDTPETRMAELSDAIQAVTAGSLPPEGQAILMAQAGHETGDGASAPGSNFFGMKSSPRSRAAGIASADYMTTEGEGKGKRRLSQSFAAYESAQQAVEEMVSLLQRKYPRAWDALMQGDPNAYVAAIRDGNYFTGSESAYRNGILSRLGAP